MIRVRPFSFCRLIFAAGMFSLVAASNVIPWCAFGAAGVDQPASAAEPDLINTIAGSWTVTDPDKDCEVRLSGDKLSITVPATNHDLSPARGLNAPRVLKKVNGDFIVQVKLTADFKPGATSTGKGAPSTVLAFYFGRTKRIFSALNVTHFGLAKPSTAIRQLWNTGTIASTAAPTMI